MTRVRRRRLTAACVILLVPAFVATAAAAPVTRATGPRAGEVSATANPFPNADGVQARGGLAIAARAGRIKVSLRVPLTNALAIALFGSKEEYFPSLGGSQRYAAPLGWQPRRPKPECYYLGNILGALFWPAAIKDPTKPGQRSTLTSLGEFPPVRVSFLAFGSLPVSATVRIRLTEKGGKSQPLLVKNFSGDPLSVRKDDPQGYDGATGCDPEWEADIRAASSLPTVVTGTAQFSVSDVTLDGQAVPVGNACRTATPVRLNLSGSSYKGLPPDRQYVSPYDGGFLKQQLDRTITGASGSAVFPGSSNLRIPPFVGCRGLGKDDTSRLVSSLVSGDDNTLAVVQGIVHTVEDLRHPRACEVGEFLCVNFPPYLQAVLPGK